MKALETSLFGNNSGQLSVEYEPIKIDAEPLIEYTAESNSEATCPIILIALVLSFLK